MTEYKTLDEWFPDGKPDGRKFHNPAWGESMYFVPYFRTVKGTWHGLGENGESFEYPPIYGFKEYVPSKKTKRVKMYCPVFAGGQGLTSYNYFHEDKGNFLTSANIKGWITQEVEVEE